MAAQKGPGEGYMEAKADALALNPKLKCKAVRYQGAIAGYVVTDDESKPSIGKAVMARDAWNNALSNLRLAATEAEAKSRAGGTSRRAAR